MRTGDVHCEHRVMHPDLKYPLKPCEVYSEAVIIKININHVPKKKTITP